MDQEARSFLKEIETNLKQDFTPEPGTYFSNEDFDEIVTNAYSRLLKETESLDKPLRFADLREQWRKVVTEYHRSQHWGYRGQKEKPRKVLTEEQKTVRELWPYIWVVIQSMIVLKTIVYYFGIRTSNDPSPENKIFLILALGTSAFTLLFFAWKKSRK